MPGIFVVDSNLPYKELIDELLLIWGASSAEEYMDQLSHLPIQ